MARPIQKLVSYREIATNIGACESIQELNRILRRNKDLMYSGPCNAALLSTVTRLVRKSSENYIDMEFLYWVYTLACYRGTKDATPSTPDSVVGLPSAKELITAYIYGLIEHHGSEIFQKPADLPVNQQFTSQIPCERLKGFPKLLFAPLFLIIDKKRWDNRDMKLWFGLHSGKRSDYYYFFLDLFADIAHPMDRCNEVVELCREFWGKYGISEDPRVTPPLMKYTSGDPSVLYDLLSHMDYMQKIDPDIVALGDVVEDATELLMQFGNTLCNPDIQAIYFDEMISTLSNVFPLMERRQAIADQYASVFREDTILYMADIYGTVMNAFAVTEMDPSQIRNWTRNDPFQQVSRMIHIRAEAIILDMVAKYHPDETTVCNFFRDTMHAFGYVTRGATDGFLYGIEQIIAGIFRDISELTKKEMTPESILEAYRIYEAGLDIAMEASNLERDPNAKPREKKPSRVDALDAHSAATKSPSREKMQQVREKAGEARKGIQKSWNKYKEIEGEVDRGLTNVATQVKRGLEGDQRSILIEGKKYTVLGVLKKAIFSIAIFNYSKIAALLGLIVTKVMGKKAKTSERRKLYEELEEELVIVDEKIRDAEADGNREAKYALMRTKQSLMNAKQRIKYGLNAETSKARLNTNVSGYGG